MARLDLEKERARLASLSVYEQEYAAFAPIAGIDEAGRGPLAGPVAAAAVILDPSQEILYINDSKKLSEARREMLYDEIMQKSLSVGIGLVSAARIDEINILQATYEAMRKAVAQLSPVPGVLLVDAVTIPGVDIRQIPIIKGDAKSISIGAASIIAKVTRDRILKWTGPIRSTALRSIKATERRPISPRSENSARVRSTAGASSKTSRLRPNNPIPIREKK